MKRLLLIALLVVFSCEDKQAEDCAGVPNGTAELLTYWYDADSDGLGTGDSSEFCNALVEAGWVLNNDDIDDNCTSNIHDCADVCDGNNICGCTDSTASNYDSLAVVSDSSCVFLPFCNDGIDNDCDDFIDIEDTDCQEGGEGEYEIAPHVPPPNPSPNSCFDGLDNDWDGLIDHDDSDCDPITDCNGLNVIGYGNEEKPPPPNCIDGVDNDGDGLADYDDPDCPDNTQFEECSAHLMELCNPDSQACELQRNIGLQLCYDEFIMGCFDWPPPYCPCEFDFMYCEVQRDEQVSICIESSSSGLQVCEESSSSGLQVCWEIQNYEHTECTVMLQYCLGGGGRENEDTCYEYYQACETIVETNFQECSDAVEAEYLLCIYPVEADFQECSDAVEAVYQECSDAVEADFQECMEIFCPLQPSVCEMMYMSCTDHVEAVYQDCIFCPYRFCINALCSCDSTAPN